MTLKDILANYRKTLKAIYDEQEATAVFYLVAEYISGFGRSQISFHMNDSISTENNDHFNLVLERLKRSEPLQYIFSEAFFYGLKFKVNSSVLIPRPETEELVEMIIWILKNTQNTPKILDIGTGSGCIAISLKRHLPDAEIYGLDISEPALEIAAENATSNQTAITFIQSDIRHYVSSNKFDVIVSNPPYITEEEGLSMDRNVMDFEPHLALFVPDQNPLEFYLAIAEFALENLHDGGLLFFEINANFGIRTSDMLMKRLFQDVQIIKDMQGKDRFISAKKVGQFLE
jgi:release factor glutamine methyltransferase